MRAAGLLFVTCAVAYPFLMARVFSRATKHRTWILIHAIYSELLLVSVAAAVSTREQAWTVAAVTLFCGLMIVFAPMSAWHFMRSSTAPDEVRVPLDRRSRSGSRSGPNEPGRK